MTYSASATDANYCLGLLTASASANLLNASSWTKSSTPGVHAATPRPASTGPGHNSFTVSEDGQSDILVYHDRSYQDITGDPLNDPNRRTRLPEAVLERRRHARTSASRSPTASTPVRLPSYNYPDRFVRHWEYRARIEANVTNLADSQFRIVTGLTGSGTVSLESTNFPGYYLRHRNYEVWVEQNDGSALFAPTPASTSGPASPTRGRGLVRVVQLPRPLHPALQRPALHPAGQHGPRPAGRDLLQGVGSVSRPASRFESDAPWGRGAVARLSVRRGWSRSSPRPFKGRCPGPVVIPGPVPTGRR